jgi:biotin transport system substrate-specific component
LSSLTYIDRYHEMRLRAFEYIAELGFAHRAVLAVSFAFLTALAAQVRIYTPFTPVPFTLQVFPVLLAGAFLGKYYGGASQLVYLGLGALGFPVFAGWRGGPAVFLGPTGGYLIGFVLAAFLVGWLIHSGQAPRSTTRILLAMVAGIGVIYLLGAANLALFSGLDAREALVMGVLPFVGLDLLKMAGAAALVRAALPG